PIPSLPPVTTTLCFIFFIICSFSSIIVDYLQLQSNNIFSIFTTIIVNKLQMRKKEDLSFDFDFLEKLVVGIGEVSQITDIPTRQIRYWEEKKIIESLT